MGLAMVRGWVAAGFDPAAIAIVEPAPGAALLSFAQSSGCRLNPPLAAREGQAVVLAVKPRSEEHTSELQSLMRISYAVFCLKKKKHKHKEQRTYTALRNRHITQ